MLAKVKLYILNYLIAKDILWNVIFGGSPSQTISGRLWEHRDVWFAEKVMKLVDWVFWKLGDGRNHCARAYVADKLFRPEVL